MPLNKETTQPIKNYGFILHMDWCFYLVSECSNCAFYLGSYHSGFWAGISVVSVNLLYSFNGTQYDSRNFSLGGQHFPIALKGEGWSNLMPLGHRFAIYVPKASDYWRGNFCPGLCVHIWAHIKLALDQICPHEGGK